MRNKIISSVLVYFIATLCSFGNATINTHGIDAYHFGDISPDEYIYKADGVDSLIFSSEEDVALYKNISGDSPRIINLDTNKILFFDIDLSQGQYNSTNILKLPASNINKRGNLIIYVRESEVVEFRYDFALDNIDQLTYPDNKKWLTDKDEAIWKFEFESYPGTTHWILVKYTKHIDIPTEFSKFIFSDREPKLANIVRTLDRQWMIDNGLFDGDNEEWLVTITSANIGTNVTSLGDSVFSNCNDLTSVTIPDSVTDIGDVVFQDCSSLTNVTISGKTTAQVSAMDYQSWGLSSNCVIVCTDGTLPPPPAETTFTFDDKTEQTYDIVGTLDRQWMTNNGLFENGTWLVTIASANIGTNVTSIGYYAFNNCSGLTNVTIPASVTNIGDNAFNGCTNLTSVTIPDSVTSIGGQVFRECSGLTSVNIPNSITNIGIYAFCGCDGLTNVVIPDSVTRIGSSAFSGCSGLASVTIPDSVTSIEDHVFYNCSGLMSVAIPDSVTNIGYEAFRNCSNLASVTISNGVTSISTEMFLGCTSLTSVTIPSSITSIGDRAFSGCSGLTSVTILGNVMNEWSSSKYTPFRNCTNLSTLVLGEEMTKIGSYMFSGCSGLTSVMIPENVTSIGDGAFSGCSGLTSVTMSGKTTTQVQEMSYLLWGLPSDCKIHCTDDDITIP